MNDNKEVAVELEDIEADGALGTKIGLAVFSFLLGLIATVITNSYLRDRAELVYSVTMNPVISSQQDLSLNKGLEAALTSLKHTYSLSVRFENVGDLPVTDFAARLVFNDQAKIISKVFKTSPAREVPWEEDQIQNAPEIRVKSVTLDRFQSLTAEVLLESSSGPHVEVFPFLAKSGSVTWKRVDSSDNLTLEGALLSLLQLMVLALVLPGLFIAIPQAIGVFFFGQRKKDEQNFSRTLMTGITAGQLIGSVLRFYLFFSMLKPATVVIKILVQKIT